MQVPQRFLYLQQNEQNFLKVPQTIVHQGWLSEIIDWNRINCFNAEKRDSKM